MSVSLQVSTSGLSVHFADAYSLWKTSQGILLAAVDAKCSRNLIVEKHLRELKMYCRHTFSPDPSNPSKLIHDPVGDLVFVHESDSLQEGCQELLTADSRETHESACSYGYSSCCRSLNII